MRSRRYEIKLLNVGGTIDINVYADRSVEMFRTRADGEVIRRRQENQTRAEAAWSLSFARLNDSPIKKVWL